ncbi:ABC transporter permease [Streptomyces viridochromogenes]|uniref:ABC transporter permease n=1 Tax=Streptomyces viridochromogenes TaxID=1938 RepID=A0A0J8C225_STRVR|nr:sugar ABC transporter permease [Streptomyces viridochromogenes]KMS71805.1 ABC transporter permease [Streptomyces viridochromogenes]KOG21092.1 ABC transporter permease [Streptomyces viridochromogenes]KOG22622.1 ABC transporter permease [Streptomyces viridochromogenes]
MQHGKYRFIVGFLALPVIVYAIFVISPFVQAFQISMTDWSGLVGTAKFVGFENFEKLWHNEDFWNALWHNVYMLIAVPIVTLGLGLFFAFMLNVGGKRRKNEVITGVTGSKFYRFVFFFPQVISITIIAVIWFNIYNPDPQDGMLNSLLGAVGLDGWQNAWLGEKSLALLCIMAVMIWSHVGFYVVLFSAAMASIPRDIYEAALLDGAGRFPTFFRITLPLLWDTVQTGWVYMGIIALDGFALVQIMSVNMGGPDGATDVMPLRLYLTAFRDSQFGYASAMGVAMLIVTMTFAVLTLRFARRERIEF